MAAAEEAVAEECAEAAEEEVEAVEAEADIKVIAHKETTDTAEKDKVATTKVVMEVMMTPEEATTTTIVDHNQATKVAVVATKAVVAEATVLATSHPSLWLLCLQTPKKPNLKKRPSRQISSK
jgi:hypothetical protein